MSRNPIHLGLYWMARDGIVMIRSGGSSQTKEAPPAEFNQVILKFKEFCVQCVLGSSSRAFDFEHNPQDIYYLRALHTVHCTVCTQRQIHFAALHIFAIMQTAGCHHPVGGDCAVSVSSREWLQCKQYSAKEQPLMEWQKQSCVFTDLLKGRCWCADVRVCWIYLADVIVLTKWCMMCTGVLNLSWCCCCANQMMQDVLNPTCLADVLKGSKIVEDLVPRHEHPHLPNRSLYLQVICCWICTNKSF